MEEETEEPGRPSVFQVLVRTFRALRGWRRDEYAAKAEIHPKTVYRCETSGVIPKPATLGKMAAAVDLTMPFVEVCLVPALEAARAASAPFDDEAFDDLKKAGAELDSALAGTCRSAIGLLVQELEGEDREPWERTGPPCEADRLEAGDAWERLATCAPQERRFLVETCPEFQTWAVAERLCHASAEAASDTAEGALELAALACRAAGLAQCNKPLRSRLRGYTLAYLANAHRVKTDLLLLRPIDVGTFLCLWLGFAPSGDPWYVQHHMAGSIRAKEDFARAWKLWREGAAAEPDLLAEWRLLDLEASLRRDDRQFAEALDLHDRARAAAPPEAMARILLKKAFTLQQQGDAERAITTLREAAPLVDGQREPHRLYSLRINLATAFCDLERYAEAEELLPEVQELAGALRKELDQVRVVWLTGKVSAGLGRASEGETAFQQVRQEFKARSMPYDCALVSLDLALLFLGQGRIAEVRALAEEMLGIFQAQRVAREALSALRLFCDAAKRGAATVELARRLARFLHRAQHDPELRFGVE